MKSIPNMTHDELMEQYQELPYSSNPNRAGELKLVGAELLRRRNLTLEWMEAHPLEVEKCRQKLRGNGRTRTLM